jgi:hypothetical protein
MNKATLARSQRALHLPIPNEILRAQIEMHVRIFDKPATANDLLKRHRALMSEDGYITCLNEGYKLQFGPNSRGVRKGQTAGSAPKDGVASAFDSEFVVGATTHRLHTDSYAWVQGNIYVLVLISGPRQLETPDFIKEALAKTVAQVDAAMKLPQKRLQTSLCILAPLPRWTNRLYELDSFAPVRGQATVWPADAPAARDSFLASPTPGAPPFPPIDRRLTVRLYRRRTWTSK